MVLCVFWFTLFGKIASYPLSSFALGIAIFTILFAILCVVTRRLERARILPELRSICSYRYHRTKCPQDFSRGSVAKFSQLGVGILRHRCDLWVEFDRSGYCDSCRRQASPFAKGFAICRPCLLNTRVELRLDFPASHNQLVSPSGIGGAPAKIGTSACVTYSISSCNRVPCYLSKTSPTLERSHASV
jgi:hypothetical protein